MDKVKILIVEDEAIVTMDLRYKLEFMGYSVPAEISSGQEAVDAASRLRPDVVLMDIWLGGEMDGIDAAEEIRRRFNIPVVYLTSHADEDTLRRAKTTGPSGYILKPFYDRESVLQVGLGFRFQQDGRFRADNFTVDRSC